MRAAAELPGGVVSVHCENTGIASWLKHELQATGRQDLGAYTESRPAFCEVETRPRSVGCSSPATISAAGRTWRPRSEPGRARRAELDPCSKMPDCLRNSPAALEGVDAAVPDAGHQDGRFDADSLVTTRGG